jgi:PAS domain S-box-containing protein
MLALLATATMLPLVGLALWLVHHAYTQDRDMAVGRTLETARALSLAVDRELLGAVSAAEALATSPSLDGRDFAAFRRQAEELLRSTPRFGGVVLSDSAGRQLVNTFVPEGTALPVRNSLDVMQRVWESGRPVVSDLFRGAATGRHFVAVDVPVLRGGRVVYDLSLTIPLDSFGALLAEQGLPEGWTASIVDSKAAIVAKRPHSDRLVGTRATAALAAGHAATREGTLDMTTREGVPVLTAFSRSSIAGWSVSIGIPRSELEAPARRALLVSASVVLGVLLAALLTGHALADRIARPVHALARLARGEAGGAGAEGPERGSLGKGDPGKGGLGAGRLRIAEIERAADALVEAEREGREAVSALERRERQLRAITDALPVLISEVDAEGRYAFVNRAYEEWFAHAADGIRGRSVAEFLGPEAFERVRPAFERALAGEAVRFESQVSDARGRTRHVEVSYVPNRDARGTPDGFFALVSDITERKREEERGRVMMAELDHRAKNLLAVVQSVIRRTQADTVPEFAAALTGRIQALARTHTLLADGRWSAAPLAEVVRREVEGLRPAGDGAVTLSGPEVRLGPKAVQAVAMVIHELATNAAKHGSLSAPGGRLSVAWEVGRDEGDAPRLALDWVESGGPPVAPPARRGFGSRLIERGLAGAVGGRAELDFAPEGVRCRLTLPLGEAAEGAGREEGPGKGREGREGGAAGLQ